MIPSLNRRLFRASLIGIALLAMEAGTASWSPETEDWYGLRIKASEETQGTWDGKPYSQVRHYTTVSLRAGPSDASATSADGPRVTYADLPQSITSFGAARIGDRVYVYGGHTGRAHSYSNVGQMKEVLMLDLKRPQDPWKTVTESERLQGLGMVAHGERLIIAGGFNARNPEGEEQDLHSTDAMRVYDTKTQVWSDLPNLPEPRSSHDIALIDDTLYVVGGWQLHSPEESHWHTTAWAMNLAEASPKWVAIPMPPFERRALTALGYRGKLYVIGGMNRDGGPTRDVEIYDPATKEWSDGPALLGNKPIAGFGAAAAEVGGRLIVTTMEGTIERLSEDGSVWEAIGMASDSRFFHRLVTLNDHQVLAIGGASMESGKFATPEVIEIRGAGE